MAGTRSRSSVVERFLGKEEVTGSIPVASSMGKEVAGPAGLAGDEKGRAGRLEEWVSLVRAKRAVPRCAGEGGSAEAAPEGVVSLVREGRAAQAARW